MRIFAGVVGASVAFVALGAFGWVIWHSYAATPPTEDLRPVPLVKAKASPIKTRPKRRGGLRIPHQDMRIYDRIAKATPTRRKAPRSRSRQLASVERLIPNTAPGVIQPEVVTLAERRISGGRAKAVAFVGGMTKPARAKRTARRRPKRVGQVVLLGEYRVLIGVYDDAQTAARRWYALMSRHADLIEQLDWFVEKVERGGSQPPIYRLQLGPLYDDKAARHLCSRFARRNVSCQFVKG